MLSSSESERVDLTGYILTPVWAEDDFLVARAHRPGWPTYIVGKNQRRPTPTTTNRLRDSFARRQPTRTDFTVHVVDLVMHEGRETIVYEDPGGCILVELVGRPMDLGMFHRIAPRLATSLGRFHASGLIHRDLKPQYVAVDPERDGAWIGGLGLAVRAARRRPAPIALASVTGSLAYMAPEQTGRMNRSIDARSDLYALGVIFYELLTGRRPFTESDPMDLIHGHIARRPPAPRDLVPGLPRALSDIVMKLLAKAPEERYQSADGVAADLRRAEGLGVDATFPLATEDFAPTLLVPERLYGRADEVARLGATLERAAAGETVPPVLVLGPSGVGKSALALELQKALVPHRGMFAAGKFDQNVRDVPYATLTQALRELLRGLLLEPEAARRRWRETLEPALGEYAALLTPILPELETLLGRTPPPVIEAPPQEAQLRFQNLFCRFIGALARAEHPLVLFIDDLQWVDAGTLAIFGQLAAAETRHLVLLGAYRDNEVGPEHPLAQRLASLRKDGIACVEIVLAPLSTEHVAELLSDSLMQSGTSVASLAELVHQKTGGNAFWVVHFLQMLHEEGLVHPDPALRAWRWDVAKIRAQRVTESVVDLMVAKLARLPAKASTLLSVLACMGPEATLAELAIATGQDEGELRTELALAADAGLVTFDETKVAFLHDRIQEAAYGAVPPEERPERHLAIARRLLAATEDRHAAAFLLANQLNRSLALVVAPEERRLALEVNVLAGRRSLAASAHASALPYFVAAESLLEGEGDPLSFECGLALAECQALTGDAKAAEARLLALSERPLEVPDLAAVARMLVSMYVGLDRNAEAVAAGLRFLERRGIVLAAHPGAAAADADAEEVWRRIGERSVPELVDLPRMTDLADRATINVLADIYAPALFTDPDLSRLVITQMVNFTLERGTADASAFAYVWMGAHMVRKADYATGLRFGELAADLLERRGQTRFRSRVYMVLGHFIHTYTRPLRRARELLERAVATAQTDGEPNFVVYSASHVISNALAAGAPLAETDRDLDATFAIFARWGFAVLSPFCVSQRYVVRSLRGLPMSFDGFPGQDAFESFVSGEVRMVLLACWMWLRKLEVAIYLDDHETAVETMPRAAALAMVTPFFIEELEIVFFSALVLARIPGRRDELAAHHARLETWAVGSSVFAGRAALVGAELARVDGKEMEAMRLYDLAIRSAREHDAPHQEALAAEYAARFCDDRGLEEVARRHRITARHGYQRWGADAKVAQLDARYPYLREETASAAGAAGPIELAAVLRMAEAVASEIVLANLVRAILRLVLEQSGARRGVLLLQQRELVVEAEALTSETGIVYRLRAGDDVSGVAYPAAMARAALRDRRAVLVADARVELASDPYVASHGARSILCLPLLHKGVPTGVLHLENDLASHVFTPAQGALLELFASQIATALENARLYEELERSRSLTAESERLSLTGSYAWTPRGETRWSEELHRIFGYDPQLAPSMDLVVARVHPDDAALVRSAFQRAERSFAEFTIAFRIVLPDGVTKHVENITRVVKDAAGRSVSYVGAIRDVTAATTAEAALQNTRAALTHVTRVATFGEMAGAIAHEVNQPIAGAQLNAKAVARWLARQPPDTKEAIAAAERMVRDTQRAEEVISRIRALFKKTGTARTPLDLNEAIQEVLALVRTDVRRHGASVDVELASDLPPVHGDRVQLQQVLVNLVVNAAEAMAGHETRLIRVRSGKESGAVRVEVADTGPGVPGDQRREVFEPFHTTKPKGMGIGLAVSRTIVEDHGGTLDLAPAGPGACFYFTLPTSTDGPPFSRRQSLGPTPT